MESIRNRNKAAWISLFASGAIFLLKFLAYYITNSAAVMSDATESVINVLAAIIALFVIRFASQPADNEHPYGHGKAEYFSSVFEGGMIFFAALVIIAQSIQAIWQGQSLTRIDVGLYIVGFATVLNLILGLYLKKVGTRENSEALQASGAHVLSDVWTTAGVMIGLVLVALTGIQWLDAVVAMLVAVNLAFSGFGIVRNSIGGLIDETDPKVLADLSESFNKMKRPGVIDIHKLRVIRAGSFHHVDAHIVVPQYWDVATVHDQNEKFESAVVKDYRFDGEIAFHVDPCKKSYCDICDVFDCPIRLSEFKKRKEFTVETLIADPPDTYGK